MTKKTQLIATIVVFILCISLPFNPMVHAQIGQQDFLIQKTNDILSKDDPVEYRAVLVAINTYDIYTLPYSVKQLENFKITLLNSGNWEESNINTIINTRATKNAIKSELSEIEQVTDDNDVTLFYFIGHGGKNKTNEYILTYDEQLYDVELAEYVYNISGKLICVFDSCYSGGMIKELKQSGRIIISASAADEPAYQVGELKSGLFGYFFNLSLSRFSKQTEHAFYLSKIFTFYYIFNLNKELDEPIRMRPQMYDGIFGPTRILRMFTFSNQFKELPNILFNHKTNNKIWEANS